MSFGQWTLVTVIHQCHHTMLINNSLTLTSFDQCSIHVGRECGVEESCVGHAFLKAAVGQYLPLQISNEVVEHTATCTCWDVPMRLPYWPKPTRQWSRWSWQWHDSVENFGRNPGGMMVLQRILRLCDSFSQRSKRSWLPRRGLLLAGSGCRAIYRNCSGWKNRPLCCCIFSIHMPWHRLVCKSEPWVAPALDRPFCYPILLINFGTLN